MALVYSKATQKSIDNAVAKARKLKPRVKIVGFGRFEVAGSKAESYLVQFLKNSDGEFTVICECKGNKAALPCYHAAACSTIYKLQVRNRQAALVERYCTCGALAVTGEGRCQDCQAAKDRADLFG